MIKILIVEDNPADARLVVEMLRDAASDCPGAETFETLHAGRLGMALGLPEAQRPDVILTDLDLPDSNGLSTFRAVRARFHSVPVIVLTGLADEAAGVSAVKEGAQDYLVKGHVDGKILLRSIRFAIERQRSSAETAGAAEKAVCAGSAGRVLEMTGKSARFMEVASLIQMVAKTSRTSVLVHGETGTGKELVANSVHYLSSRKNGPFIKINCSAIPDSLLEAEMFGYEKGAFTDARQGKLGLFELADGGTIFLDEIGDMDVRLQPKLLQILENRSFRKLGGVKDIQVDVRVIAATNRNLEAMVRENRFREDLYYRLKVMEIDLPPLRERKEDIIPLAERFLLESCSGIGGEAKGFSKECREKLLGYSWPGNIRELKNTVERAAILASSGEIRSEHLPKEVSSCQPRPGAACSLPPDEMTLEEVEVKYILQIMEKVGGNKTKASEILGISRLTLREKLKRAGVED